MHGDRADCGAHDVGLEPFLGELQRRHWQCANHAKHVTRAQPAQLHGKARKRKPFGKREMRKPRHRRAIDNIKKTRRLRS